MTYDAAAQTHEPVMLDGEELKIGDEVIIARQPPNLETDGLWTQYMRDFVGKKGTVEQVPTSNLDRSAHQRAYGDTIVRVNIDGDWWFRLSELERAHTYHQTAPVPLDTPTEFPNLVHTNETTGPGLLHPTCRTTFYSPYNRDFLINESLFCPFDDLHGALSLRPGYDAYLTQVEFDRAQKARRERFAAWRDDREFKRNRFLRSIRAQLTAHPFANTKKGSINWHRCSAFDRGYYDQNFRAQHRYGRAAAKLLGKLVGHFHPSSNKQRALPDDEVFALLRSALMRPTMPFQVRYALEARTDQAGAAYRAYEAARRKIGNTSEWQHTPWADQDWFAQNDAALDRLPHISTVNPQEVAYYQSVDKLIRGIETRTKPGRFLAKFFPNLTPDQVRQYANDYLVATAPKQLHFARTQDDIITAIDEGPSESCQTRGYYDKAPDERPWYAGHIHPAACYASGDFEVAYITDNNKPASLVDLHAGAQRITARAICNATNKKVARIYGDAAKLLPLLTSAGYVQVERALVECRMLKIANENGSGWIMPYVDAGIGSGGGSLDVDSYYDYDSGKLYWVLVRPEHGEHSTYEGYNKKGVLGGEEERHRCPRCNAAHDDEDDIRYSDYENEHYCSECEDDFVGAVVRVGRSGREHDMVLEDNAIDIDGDWYVNDGDLLARCGFVQCIHCDEWTSLDNTTTTDSGRVCCQHQVVELAEESPDGNEYGYCPDCTRYVNTETGETVWLDDNSDVDDFTREDDSGEEVPKYVSLDTWQRMQDERDRLEAQPTFEFQGPLPRAVPVMPRLSEPVFDDLRI